jgi:hypothetical protein
VGAVLCAAVVGYLAHKVLASRYPVQ